VSALDSELSLVTSPIRLTSTASDASHRSDTRPAEYEMPPSVPVRQPSDSRSVGSPEFAWVQA
jgi:hypothetical protein